MNIEQVSVFLENKAGSLAEVTAILAEADIRIVTLALSDTAEYGVMRLIVPDAEQARGVLKKRGLTSSVTQVVAAQVADNPRGIHRILEALTGAGVNIEYMYTFFAPGTEKTILIFKFDAMDRAEVLLRDLDVVCLARNQLCDLT